MLKKFKNQFNLNESNDVITASPSGASYFAQKKARNTTDWWRSAMDHGKEKEERRSAVSPLFSFPPSLERKFSSRDVGYEADVTTSWQEISR